MNISVFGLGYVGTVSAACLSSRGHRVIGVDVNPLKVEMINQGLAPVVEPGLAELVAETVANGSLRATTDGDAAISRSELSVVCVGTPSAANGSIDTTGVERVATSIGSAMAASRARHTVVIRATVLPGTSRSIILPLLESASGMRAGDDFGLSMNPEYLREGSSIADFLSPAKTVIGEFDEGSGDATAALFDGLPGPVFRVPLELAEMTKYAENAFHALKISFANEIGVAAKAFGVDSHALLDILCSDRKLNISPAYLRPGFAFGGSCLPKDLRALIHAARRNDVDLPLIENILPSNERHLQRAFDAVVARDRRQVGVVGLSFKDATDDLRESPMVELCERLIGKGFTLKIYDPNVSLARLTGANKDFIENRIPHLSVLLADSLDELLEHAEVCVIGSSDADVVDAIARSDIPFIVDLVRPGVAETASERYTGLAW
jgi:GDP-mannose 6-dehydrogenase